MVVPELKPVFSSHIEAVGWDDGVLYVRWLSGKTSAYQGVPADVAEKAVNNWSVGEFIRTEIKPNYRHQYVSDDA